MVYYAIFDLVWTVPFSWDQVLTLPSSLTVSDTFDQNKNNLVCDLFPIIISDPLSAQAVFKWSQPVTIIAITLSFITSFRGSFSLLMGHITYCIFKNIDRPFLNMKKSLVTYLLLILNYIHNCRHVINADYFLQIIHSSLSVYLSVSPFPSSFLPPFLKYCLF